MVIAIPCILLWGWTLTAQANEVHQHTSNSKPLLRANDDETSQVTSPSRATGPVIDLPTAAAPTPTPTAMEPNQLRAHNPASNPLIMQTQPEEVAIVTASTLTLREAIEQAYRNNPELQIARLELERSQAALQAAQVTQFPTVTMTGFVQEQLIQSSE